MRIVVRCEGHNFTTELYVLSMMHSPDACSACDEYDGCGAYNEYHSYDARDHILRVSCAKVHAE